MYGDSIIAELLQSHGAPAAAADKENMDDIHDSPRFREAYQTGG